MIRKNYILIRKEDSKPFFGIYMIDDDPDEEELLYKWVVVNKNTLKVDSVFTDDEDEKFSEIFEKIDSTQDKMGTNLLNELNKISDSPNDIKIENKEEIVSSDDVLFNEITKYSIEVEYKHYESFASRLNKRPDIKKLVKLTSPNKTEYIRISGFSIDYSEEHLPQLCIIGNSVQIKKESKNDGKSYDFFIGTEYSVVDIDYIEEAMYNYRNKLDFLKYTPVEFDEILNYANDTFSEIFDDIKNNNLNEEAE